MLVLSRREGEKIMIGGDIEVVVLEIRYGIVIIGIEAPKDVRVDRQEVHEERLKAAKKP